MGTTEEAIPGIVEEPATEAGPAKTTYTSNKKQKKPKSGTDEKSTIHHEHAKDPRKAQDDQVMGVRLPPFQPPSISHNRHSHSH